MIFQSQKTIRVPEVPLHEAIFFNISDYEDKIALVRTHIFVDNQPLQTVNLFFNYNAPTDWFYVDMVKAT